jgi:hypothetical protein
MFKRSFYTILHANVEHAALCDGTSPAARKTQTLDDFDKNCFLVPDWDISTFKRSFYAILHAECRARSFMRRNRPCCSQNAIICRFSRKLCYFVPDCDITTFKRSFYSILHAERSAQRVMRRDKPSSPQIATFCRFGRNLCYFVRDWDITMFKRSFYTILHANVEHAALCDGTSPAARKTQTLDDFDKNCFLVPDWDISTFKRSFYAILHAERSAHSFMRRNRPCSSEFAIICRFWRKLLFRSWLRYFDV